ncbi:hypothetical protein SERLA73DRAFT_180587 [Serpula lacrymans var. lacrymans S7.3]|uniref:Uncharacterized protein n=2 Tax=Serpula lacrymans var. lacrymans TaxID=341189 RepID=F8PVE6_SERL3|nr:uncharacterized protein SERLADRAFT_466255 [Serpula lacrymans var. lacrymans S7.9]EGO00156.1 hypothetical protein SERLA73DRAFT_180587 [Serpula lacrymans var. lacrymans S7.3]EGO25717.1 hypothetical protein SERLADRAFT_466255 [Serpula lacrymans var. lacrymans S7.9]
MSVARAALLVRPKPAATHILQRRFASHDSHSHEHHDEHQDATQYPREAGFNTPFWRNTFLLSLAVVGFYKYAPAPGEDVYLTRYLAHYGTPSEIWARINEKHLLLSQQISDNTILQTDAKRPNLHRYRHPQSLDAGSSHLQSVGTGVDMSSVTVKTASE